jgi:four helix bundle protein
MTKQPQEFDLEERTAQFGEAVIDLLKPIAFNPLNSPLISQLVRSATSVGANYCEADDAITKKAFRHCIGVSRREAKESKHWLRMMARAVPERAEECRHLWQEARELNLILSAILRNSGGK